MPMANHDRKNAVLNDDLTGSLLGMLAEDIFDESLSAERGLEEQELAQALFEEEMAAEGVFADGIGGKQCCIRV